MDYFTAKQAAYKWGITANRVTILCKNGKINGAVQVGKQWMIPNGTQKPCDGRTKRAKVDEKKTFFRFPLYVNFSENSFIPPLSEEEKMLRTAQCEFFACDFAESEKKFEYLCEEADNIYVKISARFFMCIVSAAYNAEINFLYHYNKLNLSLSEEFPHKSEMTLFRPLMSSIFGMYKSAAYELNRNTDYGCDTSVYYLKILLSFLIFIPDNIEDYSAEHLYVYELLCRKTENDGFFWEAQELHRLLFVSYMMTQNEQQMIYHLKCLLTIAYEHDLFYAASDLEPFYSDIYKSVLNEFPKDFAEKIHRFGTDIYNNFAVFTNKYKIANLYTDLTKNSYRIILYVSQGYSNKKIAQTMNLSERTVSNMLSGIYATFGVKNKQELLDLMNKAL